jgi:hypothetical protein
MREIGASKRNADRCRSDASREWIRFGAVAFLWWFLSTLLLSPVATLILQRPSNSRLISWWSFFISFCVTEKPDGVVHVSLFRPRSIALPTSDSIQDITAIGPGTMRSIAARTALTVSVKSSFSTSTPFSFNASRMYPRLENGLAL